MRRRFLLIARKRLRYEAVEFGLGNGACGDLQIQVVTILLKAGDLVLFVDEALLDRFPQIVANEQEQDEGDGAAQQFFAFG